MALKILHEEQNEEIRHEASIMAEFNHPNIVKIFGIVTKVPSLIMVMEHFAFKSLDDFFEVWCT